jgi:surface carbohydrate biosynthesis protein
MVPVEIQTRELDAKLLLSCIAAERGFPVILGSRAFVHFLADSVPRGVYLAKSMRSLSIRMFDILRQLGHEIVCWDEDGLVRLVDEEYYRRRLSPITMRQISHLIAWGPDNARAFREYPGYHGAPIHITGNPRVDLMRKELREFHRPQVDAIRDEYGDFVLVNTNFGQVNHYISELGDMTTAAETTKSGPATPFDIGKGRHRRALYNHFQEMLPALCEALADRRVILRPHPSENHHPWHAIASRCGNLAVVHEGSVIPWLIAAQTLVHNGCTTGVEAAVLGTPVVSFMPVVSETYDRDLPNSVGLRVHSLDDLCTMVRDLADGDPAGTADSSEFKKIMDRHVAALNGPLAAERIVDVLEQAEYGKRQPPATPLEQHLRGWVRNKWRTMIKRRNMRRSDHRNNAAYHDHRFPEISTEEIRSRVMRMGHLLNRFDGIRVERHSKHVFWISA